MAGLYIHIPFCIKKCFYCDFYSIPTNNNYLFNITISSIMKEIDNKKPIINNIPVYSIYIGGGTPNILPAKLLNTLLSYINKNINMNNLKEFTIESNPEFISNEVLKVLSLNGVNRISLGVQSFNDKYLTLVGRSSKSIIINKAVEKIINSNIDIFNIDLIFGFPNQTMKDLDLDLEKVVNINPTHISYYALSLEKGTHLNDQISNNKIPNIDENLTAEMYLRIINFLTQKGYNMYEISNFCKDNNTSIHNLNYWNIGEYYGFGPSATSYDGIMRYTNISNVEKYNNLINSNNSPVYYSEKIDKKKRLYEFIMLSLRKTMGFDIDKAKALFNIDFKKFIKDKLPYLLDDKYMLLDENRIKMSIKGFLIFDYIVSEIFFKLEDI